ncbi:MAG: GIY-YIG nuclease family protein [Pseudomonadota bacterium]
MRIVGYVYMLKCADNSYYIGSHRGEDPQHRAAQHNDGVFKTAHTYKRRPVTLVWSEFFYRYDEMVAVERQLKGWSRKKKEALIDGDDTLLKQLSARGYKPSIDADPSRRGCAAPQDEAEGAET